jgi:hypothetical protein
MFSWLSLTSGLFDRLKIDFLSSVQAGKAPKLCAFLRAPLDTQRQFHEVGNSEAILVGNAISLNIMALERNRVIRKSLFC